MRGRAHGCGVSRGVGEGEAGDEAALVLAGDVILRVDVAFLAVHFLNSFVETLDHVMHAEVVDAEFVSVSMDSCCEVLDDGAWGELDRGFELCMIRE
jgi:hypothetical protein